VFYSSDLFPFRPGQAWIMTNDRGELTFFETLPAKGIGCEDGELVDLHITKSANDTYWEPGVANAEIHWVMHHDENGQWRAVASLIHWDSPDPNSGDDVSIDYVPQDTQAYLVVPALFREGQTLTLTGYAQWYMDRSKQTPGCLKSAEKGPLLRWTSKIYAERVETPAYTGPAVVNEEFEGCSSAAEETADSHSCPHEKWYFAPGVGLVEINSVWQDTIIKRVSR
jgi:hypothetical protein